MSKSSIHKAILKGSLAEVKKVLSSHNISTVDTDGMSPLHVAAQGRSTEILKLLISKKADVNAVDYNGWTALHNACNKALFENCQILLQAKNISVNMTNNDGQTPLAYLVRLSEIQVTPQLEQYRKLLQRFIKSGAEVNLPNRFGETPLHLACLCGNKYSVRFLLENGADVNSLNSKKQTGLNFAVFQNKPEIASILLEYGADPFMTVANGVSPMEIAIKQKQMDLVTLMTTRALRCGIATRDCVKEGIIDVSFNAKQVQWSNKYCVIKDGFFYFYNSNDMDEKPMASNHLSISALKLPNQKDREKFQKEHFVKIVAPERTICLLFESDSQMTEWIQSINRAKRAPSLEDVASFNMEEVDVREHLQSIWDQEGNHTCSECGFKDAPWVALKFGTFVCLDCAEIIQELEISPIKSIQLDQWELSDVMFVKCNGNIKVNLEMEGELTPDHQKPSANSSLVEKTNFIQAKYIRRVCSKKKNSAPSDTNYHKIVALRLSSFEENYKIDDLLHSLRISQHAFSNIKKSSKTFTDLQTIMRDIENVVVDERVQTLIRENNLQFSIGLNGFFLEDGLSFVSSIKSCFSKQIPPSKTALNKLHYLLHKFVEIQKTPVDQDTLLVLQWWIPQSLELMVLLECSQQPQTLTQLLNFFLESSSSALYLLTGDYLLSKSMVSEMVSFQSLRLEEMSFLMQSTLLSTELQGKIDAHTEAVSALSRSQFDLSPSSQPSTHLSESTSSSFKTLRRAESEISLESRASQTSEKSPRFGEGDHQPEIQIDNKPLFSLLTINDRVSKVLNEFLMAIPQAIHKQIFGISRVHDSFVAMTPDSISVYLNTNLKGTMQDLQEALQELRAVWPMSHSRKASAIDQKERSQLTRYILLAYNHVLRMYRVPVCWSVPEVWSSWQNLRVILDLTTKMLLVHALVGADFSAVHELLSHTLVQIRWTFSLLTFVEKE